MTVQSEAYLSGSVTLNRSHLQDCAFETRVHAPVHSKGEFRIISQLMLPPIAACLRQKKEVLIPTNFSGLNPSTSSRNTLLWETESPLGIIRNLRMVPRVEPRNKTVRFLLGPASVSTTIAVSWYLDRRTLQMISSMSIFTHISSNKAYLPIVFTTQGRCPNRGTVSSISGWVFTKFRTSSGSVVEELNLEPWTEHPPGLKQQKRGEEIISSVWRESGFY